MKIAFHTLGCKVNQYESEAMAQLFREHGHVVVDETEFADVYVINRDNVIMQLDNLQRFLRNYNIEFFSNALDKGAYADRLADAITLLKCDKERIEELKKDVDDTFDFVYI